VKTGHEPTTVAFLDRHRLCIHRHVQPADAQPHKNMSPQNTGYDWARPGSQANPQKSRVKTRVAAPVPNRAVSAPTAFIASNEPIDGASRAEGGCREVETIFYLSAQTTRARLAVYATFAIAGMLFATWVPRTPEMNPRVGARQREGHGESLLNRSRRLPSSLIHDPESGRRDAAPSEISSGSSSRSKVFFG
jgi:hypothetical protein